MKLRIILFSASMLFIISGITTAQDDAKSASATAEWSESQKISYILGTQIGDFSKQSELEVSLDLFAQGLNDVIKGSELAMTQAEIATSMAAVQQKAQEGLQYKVITMGEGAKPKATDKVKVHYSGTLIDGKEFDSSYKRNQPAEFGLNQVIKGWTEGVQLMNVGSKYEFYIPSKLAYGPNGPASIGPDQTLIFTVELLDITTP